MPQSENLKIKGEVTLTATSKDGEVRKKKIQNLVVDEGLNVLIAKIFNTDGIPYRNAFQTTEAGNAPKFFQGRKNLDVYYDIAEIAVGSNNSPQLSTDTYATTINVGTKITKKYNNAKVGSPVTPSNALFVQTDYNADSPDTLSDSSLNPIPIREVLLIAAAYDSPNDSNPNRKLIARTVLTNSQGFLKYKTDRLTVAWKLQLSAGS